MSEPSTLPSTTKTIRRLVEHYTPDGTAGRIPLATVTGATAAFGLWMTAIALFAGGTLSALTAAPIAGVLTAALLLVTVLTLWPVYLSAIGRVDSPTAYSKAVRRDDASSRVDRLRDAYRAGTLSEQELERQLEAALGDEERSNDGSPAPDRDRSELATE